MDQTLFRRPYFWDVLQNRCCGLGPRLESYQALALSADISSNFRKPENEERPGIALWRNHPVTNASRRPASGRSIVAVKQFNVLDLVVGCIYLHSFHA